VAVRLRPLSDEETSHVSVTSRPRFGRPIKRTHDRAWTCSSTTIQQTGVRCVEGKSAFSFDHMFCEESTTEAVYDEMVRPIVWGITNGKHGTVFCYGQTGSGKTFTMQGNDLDVREEDGLLQLAVKDIFQWIRESNRESMVRISYFEIYNEQVRDLLSGVVDEDPANRSQDAFQGQAVAVRLDPKEGVKVNCREVEVNSVQILLDLLQFGNRYRQVASTSMNNRSSRSHAIFRVTVETRTTDNTVRLATLNLVDLAGSENSQTSDTTNLQQREGGTINKSLLSLSKVIHSLSLPLATRPKFIGYRDSKLTFILQPHLSGNALMAVICNASPAHAFVEETRSTLRFASRAKLIEIKPQVNEVAQKDSALAQRLHLELEETRKSLLAMEQRSSQSENALVEAARELKKIKQLMFGDEDFRLESLDNFGMHARKKKGAAGSIPTVDETRNSIETTEHYIYDQNITQLSGQSIPRITRRRDPVDVARTPPSEVLILTVGSQDMNQTQNEMFASDMEEKAKFLEHRLEFAEDVIEKLMDDLKASRNALHHVVHRNVRLASKVERYREKLENLEEQEGGKLRAQYILLKWSMYLSLFFFFFHLHDLFAVSVMFVWLCLETYTA
jgi:centromeric protein E